MSAWRRIALSCLAAIVVYPGISNGNPLWDKNGTSQSSPLKRFELTLTWEQGQPDGFPRYMVFINGQYPGPPLYLNQGDNVEVIVRNELPFDTTIHLHGIEQHGTPWSDGVPGVSQRLITRGNKFTYQWTATDYGTYWYHCHSKGLLSDGYYGPIQITPSASVPTPFHMITNDTKSLAAIARAVENPSFVILQDWNHLTSPNVHDIAVASNLDALCSHSIVFNLKGAVNCLSPQALAKLVNPVVRSQLLGGLNLTATGCLPLIPAIQLTATHHFEMVPADLYSQCTPTNSQMEVIEADPSLGWISLNLIGAGNVLELTISIDDHPMIVYAVDGYYATPVEVDAITITSGTRYAVLVKLDKEPAIYTIRTASTGPNQLMSGYAQLSYRGNNATVIDHPSINYAGVNTTAGVRYLNTTTLEPYPNVPPARNVDATFILHITRVGLQAWTWALDNNNPFGSPLERATPLLVAPSTAENTTTIRTTNGTWVDIIIIADGGANPTHPMHKHNNKGYLIGQGVGTFNYSSVAEAEPHMPGVFNLVNPPLKDSFYTLTALVNTTWMVIRYQVVNPMATLLHCHINTHLEGGLSAVILDGVDKFPPIPELYLQAALIPS